MRIGFARFGLVLAGLGLLLHLAVPGLSVPRPVSPLAELQGILGDFPVELCSHLGDPSNDPAAPAPRHRPGHDCIACCSPASLAAVLPPAVTIPLPSEAGEIETSALAAAGPARSIYAARQRSPPGLPAA
ncbi:MAG: hypothetical protein R3D62_09825 [Xanthobacteraceae bacterium]